MNNSGSTGVSDTACISVDIIGYMSVDVSRQYHSDLSQLKYLNNVPKGKISLDLNYKLDEAIKRTTDDNDEKISLLLEFLIDQRLPSQTWGIHPNFITYRRTLISIMCSAYGYFEPCSLIASFFDDCIYLCSIETAEEMQRRKSRSKQEQRFCAWGYKFEQYLLADSPMQEPDPEKPVIENEEFSLFFYSIFGEHKLLYGAQIDGMLATDGRVLNRPDTGKTEDNLEYLRRNEFIELKTNREIKHRRQEQNFRKYKLLRCWCQCYLARLKGLLVGFRNDQGIVQRLQCFDTEEIVQYCKYDWAPQVGLNFLNYFLCYVNKYFQDNAKTSSGPISFQFDVNGTDIKVSVRDSDVILPEWYRNAKK